MLDAKACNVLMVCPRFEADTFWTFKKTCEAVGAKHTAPPLGLITVAALLPPSWTVRLVDRNTEELTDDDLAWADLVFTGGMLPQGGDALDIVDLCRARGKPVAVGGPAITSSPHACPAANFRVLGEAEAVIDQFVAAWEAGEREGVFEAEKFQVDVTKTPIPRFDLLKFDDYLHVGVQFSRGCPFTCEFCDIIELYGRVPRAKTSAQMLAELDELYRLGYRGHIDFVDDNLIGNKKAVKAFLPELAKWLEAHDYPFEFTTEASLNLADDSELLMLLNRANFVGRVVRARGLHHRFRQRDRLGRGCDGRADRGSRDPGLHGGSPLRAAQHPAHAAAGKRGPLASRPRAQGSRGPDRRRSVHAWAQLRHAAAAA